MRRVQLGDELDDQRRLSESLVDVGVLVAENGNKSARVELEKPCWAGFIEVDANLVV